MLMSIGQTLQAVKDLLLEQFADKAMDKLADDHWSFPQNKAVSAQT